MRKFNEALLKPGQRVAAEMMLEREFAPKKDERITDEQIAEAAGVTRMTFYRWRTNDENFIAYYSHRVDTFMKGEFGFVMRRLHDGIASGSMKGIELYLKMAGLLIDKQSVELDDKRGEDTVERQQRLREQLAELQRQKDALDKKDADDHGEE